VVVRWANTSVLPHPSARKARLEWRACKVLFGGSAACLVYLFARPIVPLPTVPEKDCNEKKPDSSSFHDEPSTSGSALTSKKRTLSDLPMKGGRPGPFKQLPQLSTLPTELQYLIFNFLNIEDAFHIWRRCWVRSTLIIDKAEVTLQTA
jgi:hypothetical protein